VPPGIPVLIVGLGGKFPEDYRRLSRLAGCQPGFEQLARSMHGSWQDRNDYELKAEQAK